MVDNLERDNEHLSYLRSYLNRRDELIKSVGFDVLSNYIGAIRTEEEGFSVKGEYWSLRSYQTFWKFLAAEQRRRKTTGEDCLIARVTHSSDIKLWLPDKEPRAEEMMIHQKEFIVHRGMIIRLLLGTSEKIEGDYIKVKSLMEAIGIEVKYTKVRSRDDWKYDLLWFNEEKWLAKWYTGVGNSLERCTITDKPSGEIESRWRVLAERAEKEDSPIAKIPSHRAIY